MQSQHSLQPERKTVTNAINHIRPASHENMFERDGDVVVGFGESIARDGRGKADVRFSVGVTQLWDEQRSNSLASGSDRVHNSNG
jgi:hypothetical protein